MGVKTHQPADQLGLPTGRSGRTAERPDRFELRRQRFIIGYLEAERDRPAPHRSVDDIKPHGFAALSESDVLALRGRKDPRVHGAGIETPARLQPTPGPHARDEYARIGSRRPQRPDGGTALRRVLSESVAPSVQ
jgi:hypothetical protein